MSTSSSDINADSGDEEVFSSEEEELSEEMNNLRMGENRGRRLSSLDKFLMEPKPKEERYILKAKGTIKEALDAVKAFKEEEELEEERRRCAAAEKQMEVQIARIKRDELKRRDTLVRDIAAKRAFPVKRGLGGLSREKKARLKKLLLNKAKEDMRKEQSDMRKAKEKYLKEVVRPIETKNLNDDELRELVVDLHRRALNVESEKIDLENKLQLQAEEIHRLVTDIQEGRGKFLTPVLKKVRKGSSRSERLQYLRNLARQTETASSQMLKRRSS